MKRFCVVMVMLMTIAAVGCGNNKVADRTASSTVSEPEAVETSTLGVPAVKDGVYGEWSSFATGSAYEKQIVSVGGPYGEMSVVVPEGWTAEISAVDDGKLTYGLYGLILKSKSADAGQIELFCSDSFGVCGTGLSQKEITLAGYTAHAGTYDDHEHWDFITFGDERPQIVAQSIDCDSWISHMWEEADTILDTLKFDTSKTEGGIGQYISDSEVEALGLMMSVSNVTALGLTVHFRQYEDKNTGELIYGEDYTLEKLESEKWEAVPMVIDNGVFTDIGYNIPKNGEAEIETNWEWLYGNLEPGTYKITKTVLDSGASSEGDNLNRYTMSAQFLIAG
ncbi:immunoglobulin-like domain-containing protein [Butyrivibrio sp. VCB2006]|uniref:immunoglobulin-like domain-containing protein n=1 Tax=Butyrivibrio sp. VCB2006 TaxID=1280679 RepID=UPI00040E6DD3|nr:immunoglobulin-like domain-containing protein [Butyrivibrio sp. VCB2006]